MRVQKSMKTVYSFRIQGTMHSCKSVERAGKLNFMFTFLLAASVDKRMWQRVVLSGQKIDPLPRANNKQLSSFIFF